MNKSFKVALAVGALAVAGGAYAATATAPIPVSATVVSICSVSAVPLAFGSYTPGITLDVPTTVSVSCSSGTAYHVRLNGGTTVGGTVANRLMTNGVTTLQYQLYTDLARTVVWGEVDGTDSVPGTGTGVSATSVLSVYGRIPGAGANASAVIGSYTDIVTATVFY